MNYWFYNKINMLRNANRHNSVVRQPSRTSSNLWQISTNTYDYRMRWWESCHAIAYAWYVHQLKLRPHLPPTYKHFFELATFAFYHPAHAQEIGAACNFKGIDPWRNNFIAQSIRNCHDISNIFFWRKCKFCFHFHNENSDGLIKSRLILGYGWGIEFLNSMRI